MTSARRRRTALVRAALVAALAGAGAAGVTTTLGITPLLPAAQPDGVPLGLTAQRITMPPQDGPVIAYPRGTGSGEIDGGGRPAPAPTTAPTTTTGTTTSAPPTTADTTTTTTEPPVTAAASNADEAVLALVNEERAKASCAPVSLEPRLTAAAQAHSDDMSAHDYFSHVSQDGRTFGQRIEAQGYPSPAAENIAKGQRTPAQVMEAWMGSEGHRRNILDCDLKTLGVGFTLDGYYWVQDFGR
ncbi:CAP domain-containing protein [Actinokineospora bangkokensis]|uniref:SCP domain-containing protein n=1 Tax=Actinokineospora bangkokensis TaxID=1193682 RepID=A0A1Q9LHP4_9PSEU|nr:CAP domain-containing protein [Actinokineospora bangkokensis]OLR91558.1 hypothetical protein BJP25_25675 [Actinokineospora bangkokensis]